MGSVITDIADAVAASLGAASLSLRFKVDRPYVPRLELKEMGDDLFVTVVPAETSMVPLSRRDDDFTYVVHVAVRRRVGSGSMTDAEMAAAADPLMRLAEEIMDHFRGMEADDFATARFVGAANAPIFDMEAIDEKRVFLSLVALTFRQARSK